MAILTDRVTRVWLALIALTVLTTWVVSKDLFSPAVGVVCTFLIAAVKVRLVMLDFMELRTAPTRVRVAFECWIAVVVAVILGLWFLTPSV